LVGVRLGVMVGCGVFVGRGVEVNVGVRVGMRLGVAEGVTCGLNPLCASSWYHMNSTAPSVRMNSLISLGLREGHSSRPPSLQ